LSTKIAYVTKNSTRLGKDEKDINVKDTDRNEKTNKDKYSHK